ncbi:MULTISPECIES: hypothetical protein [unclassified Oceanispirochaeta]|uniref:hypothetical protein n=1 Tax=unclassified Oceanispirochaeta TaxID=2635722 RepID=UPI0011C01C3E|nr:MULTISPECIES: hypothetical protein [unclassified Oceanispirochaeta]MBF9015189.1 hypothetical protein [Oceanispirochaeta sp. M2]NPD71647.1 hypothetical protein [Oceanispirochaeta sp. M1]
MSDKRGETSHGHNKNTRTILEKSSVWDFTLLPRLWNFTSVDHFISYQKTEGGLTSNRKQPLTKDRL